MQLVPTSESAIENTKKILALQNNDQLLLYKEKISSPIAVMLLNHLFYTPIIFFIAAIEKEFNISYPTAAHLIQQFVKIGILKEVTGKKRAKKYYYTKYVKYIIRRCKSPVISYI